MKVVSIRYIVAVACILLGLMAHGKSFKIYPNQVMLKASSSFLSSMAPGDTLLLQPGVWHHLSLINLTGSAEKPIVVINDNGLVDINSDHYYGISVSNCKFIHITGTGSAQLEYGIKISQIKGGALGGNKGTTDIEIDHIEIDSVKGVGMMIKTDATCTEFQRHQFTQKNTYLHHNKISNTGLEGLYIGSSNYPGRNIQCNGQTTLVLDPLLENVEVSNNHFDGTGWDAIQVSSAQNLDIHHNHIYHDSKLLQPNQMSGIIIGAGSTGTIRNNLIKRGNGNGINSFALGNIKIYNNIIIEPGQWHLNNLGKYGIYVNDKLAEKADVFNIISNNMILDAPCESIHLQTKVWNDNTTVISNNILINPGCYAKYDSNNIGYKAYISSTKNKAKIYNNFENLDYAKALMEDSTGKEYTPLHNSPLIDRGNQSITSIVLSDFYDNSRIQGKKIDIGPVEYQTTNSTVQNPTSGPSQIIINPIENHTLKVVFKNAINEKYSIELTNLEGRIVFQRQITSLENTLSIPLPNHLAQGIYFLSIYTSESKETVQLMLL